MDGGKHTSKFTPTAKPYPTLHKGLVHWRYQTFGSVFWLKDLRHNRGFDFRFADQIYWH